MIMFSAFSVAPNRVLWSFRILSLSKLFGKGTQISRKTPMKLTVVVGFGMFPDRLNRSWSSEHEFVKKRQGHQGFRAPQSKYWTI